MAPICSAEQPVAVPQPSLEKIWLIALSSTSWDIGEQLAALVQSPVAESSFLITTAPKTNQSQPAVSRIEPVLELNLEALEHLFFDCFDVSELAPTSHITVLGRSLNFYDELFHQSQLARVFFPQMLFAKISSLFLPVFGP
jgi:hypothetical protein